MRRRRALPLLVIVLLLLGWLGFLATDPLRPGAAATGSATGYLPENARQDTVSVMTGGPAVPGYVEQARYRGGAYTVTVPRTTLGRIDAAEQNPQQWWRETMMLPETGSRRIRLRSVGPDGIRRHIQSWDRSGMTFTPSLLELPADVAPGREWTSVGTADIGGSRSAYRHRATATAAEPGCLTVSSTISIGDEALPRVRTENATWCEGRGIVAEEGHDNAGGPLAEWRMALDPDAVPGTNWTLNDQPPAEDRAGWGHGVLQPFDGDETFGYAEMDLLTTTAPTVNGRGALALTQVHTDDLQTLLEAREEVHVQAAWIRPGGKVLTVTAVGDLFAVTTSDRWVRVYDDWGVLIWQARTDDVAVAPAVRVGRDRLAVATLAGRVTVFDAATGAEVWARSLTRGVPGPLISDGRTLLVMDQEDALHALSAVDGTELWSQDVGDRASGLYQTDDRVVVLSGNLLLGLAREDGRLTWARRLDSVGAVLAGQDGVVGALTGEGLQVVDARTGADRFTVRDARAQTAAGGMWWVLVGSEIRALDSSGAVVHRYPGGQGDYPEFVTGGGRVWLFRRSDETTLSATWIGRPSR